MRLLLAAVALGSLLAPSFHSVARGTEPERVSVVAAANSGFVGIEGRAQARDDGVLRIAYPGVTLHVAFSGPRLDLSTYAHSATTWIDFSVDGGPFQALQLPAGASTTTLFDGQQGDHQATVVKRSEAWQGVLDIIGFGAPGGNLNAAPALPARKLMFIGDSITCGQGAGASAGEAGEVHASSSGRHTFGYLVAQHLNAQVHLVCYGGRGILRNWQGVPGPESMASVFYERALPDAPYSDWDHASFIPDAIVITLGQNDFTPGIPDEAQWVQTYLELVRKVMRDAPDAHLFLANSPMQAEDSIKRRVLIHYIESVVQGINHPRVHALRLPHLQGHPGDGHPTREDHQILAGTVTPALSIALGW